MTNENINQSKEEEVELSREEKLKRGYVVLTAVGVGIYLFGRKNGYKKGFRDGAKRGYEYGCKETLKAIVEEIDKHTSK